jgi:hypothetical protein
MRHFGHERARYNGMAIAGFLIRCAVGAAYEQLFGLDSVAIPVGLLVAAMALGLLTDLPQIRSQT